MAVPGFSMMDGVKLIVKTPNQRIGDIQVSCEIGWTVQKLKEHLSSVYPTKPCKTMQRLIYAGKLLQDHLMLMDVFCKDSDSHTVHLVCSTPSSESIQANSDAVTTDSSSLQPGATEQTTPTVNGAASASSDSPPSVRQRLSTQTSTPSTPIPTSNSNGAATPLPLNEQWQQYMQAMQQQWNYYYQHQHAVAAAYHQQSFGVQYPGSPWAFSGATFPPATMPFVPANMNPIIQPADQMPPGAPLVAADPVAPSPMAQQQDQRQEPAQPAEPAVAANQNIPRVNAGGAMFDDDEDEEGGRRRDWLDWVYTFLRCGVLLSIMYFYSTLSRLALVFLLGFIVYLYQNGWFSLPQAPPAAAAAPPQAPHNANEPADAVQDGVPAGDDEDGAEDVTPGVRTELIPPPPSIVTLLWTFVSSFFTSLVPQRPQLFQQP